MIHEKSPWFGLRRNVSAPVRWEDFWIFCFFSWVVCFFLAQPHMSTIYVVNKMETILSQYWFYFEMKWQHISIYSSTTEPSDIIHIMILTKYSDSRIYKSEFIACINIWFELLIRILSKLIHHKWLEVIVK